MSASTWPGPTEGSWSMSPTISSAARSGTASSSACISRTSTIEVSSTTSRSQSSGLSAAALEAAGLGIDLEQPVDGLGLEAGGLGHALGGAAGRRAEQQVRRPWPRGSAGSQLTMVVLPTPGPPVMTRTFDSSASRIAVDLARRQASRPVFCSTHGSALSGSIAGPGQLAAGQAQQALGNDLLGPVEPGRGRCTASRRPCRRSPRRRPSSSSSAVRTSPAVDLEQLRRPAAPAPRPAGRNGPRPWPRSAHRTIPARTRIIAVFSMPSFMAIASAVLKPMPRMSRASR